MKAKVRKITVDTEKYVWAVTEVDWHTVNLKVWVEGNKRMPWFEVKKKFDEPWINFSELTKSELKSDLDSTTPVTPGLVAFLIKEVKNRKFKSVDNKPIFLKITTDDGLLIDEVRS